MTPSQIAAVTSKIQSVFNSALGPGTGLQASLAGVVASKLYEARVLAELLEKLTLDGYTFVVINGSVGLKAAPGPINTAYAYIKVFSSKSHRANIWTDVEFVGLSSYLLAGNTSPSARGEYHELDIVVCDPKATGRPNSDQVYVGVEAKHWAHIPKKLLREVLGVRRELSFVERSRKFAMTNLNFPCPSLEPLNGAEPRSHMVFAFSTVYSTGSGPLTEWVVPSEQFDVELWNIVV